MAGTATLRRARACCKRWRRGACPAWWSWAATPTPPRGRCPRRPRGPAQPGAWRGVLRHLDRQRGRAQDRLDAARADNPHLKFADARHRGSIRFRLGERALHGELRAVRDVRDAHSGAYPLASYVVEAGRAGVQPA